MNKSARKIEDERSISEDIQQIKLAKEDGYVPVVYPSLMDRLDLDYPLIAGLPETKTYYCNEGYGLVKYNSDRFGFRNEDNLWTSKSVDIVIGDSFVHGGCVSDFETLPYQLSKLTNFPTLNLGIGGNDPTHYLAYSKIFIPKLTPTRVFLVFYANDYGPTSTSAIEEAYVNEGKTIFAFNELRLFDRDLFQESGLKGITNLRDIQKALKKPMPAIRTRAMNALVRYASLPTIRKLVVSQPPIQSLIPDIDPQFGKTYGAINSVTDLCDKYNCDVTVLFIPNSHFYRPDRRADRYAELIKKVVVTKKLQFVDGRDVIDRAKGSDDFALKGPHLSPLGYKKLAEQVFVSLNR